MFWDTRKTQRNVFSYNFCDTRKNTAECVSCGDEEKKTETASVFPFVNGKMRRTQRNVFQIFPLKTMFWDSRKTQRNVFSSNFCDTRKNTAECVSCGDERRKTETASVFPFVIGRMRRTQRNVFPVGDMHLREKGKKRTKTLNRSSFLKK